MLILYRGSGAGDFDMAGSPLPAAVTKRFASNAAKLLEARGSPSSAQWLRSIPFEIVNSGNFFGDDFHVLHAAVPFETYESLRESASEPSSKAEFRAIAEALSEIGPYIRLVAVDLELEPASPLTPSQRARALKPAEIDTLVYKYIGVDGGYLADFTYGTHREFYRSLGLDANPDDYPGTTRQRFTTILEESPPETQAQILGAILARYPAGSSELRTEERAREIRDWLRRLQGTAPVATPRPSITSDVVERALADAELLIQNQGATSGVDRVHTAFHGFLQAVCESAGLNTAPDASVTELMTNIRNNHPSFAAGGPRADDIRRIMRSMAAIADALNPVRNRASIAHPNESLLAPAEAMLVINAVRTLLHYVDAKLAAP